MLLLLATALASDLPARRAGIGFTTEVGKQRLGPVWVPATDLSTVELRLFLNDDLSVDLQADLRRLLLTRLLTSSPRLPVGAYLHYHLEGQGRWGFAFAPGLRAELGLSSLVIDEELARRPLLTLAPALRVGPERTGDHKHLDLGLYLNTALGGSLSVEGPEPYGRVVFELSWSWSVLR